MARIGYLHRDDIILLPHSIKTPNQSLILNMAVC